MKIKNKKGKEHDHILTFLPRYCGGFFCHVYLLSEFIVSFRIVSFQLPGKLNELEPQTNLSPLQITLNERQESIAKTLVHHSCDVNAPDKDGRTLLHRFIEVGDDYAAKFLIEHGADIKAVTYDKNETVLHLAASYKYVEDIVEAYRCMVLPRSFYLDL